MRSIFIILFVLALSSCSKPPLGCATNPNVTNIGGQTTICYEQGPAGPAGAQGAQGPAGVNGTNGTDGTNGQNCTVVELAVGSPNAPNGGIEITCPDGTSDIVGNGADGTNGSNGINGVNGSNGANGTSCSVATLSVGSVEAPNGGSLITCSDGTSSIVLNGTDGANGTNGTSGTDGTVITPIQFCTGFTQSYPNTFAESGVCIAGIMYGVYSANGGFLSMLPPGEYSSDGINASCTFSISVNCVVGN